MSKTAHLESQFWTNPSVLKLASEDPVSQICSRASAVALQAIQAGWTGPPFDPAKLAVYLGHRVVPREDVADARTITSSDNWLTIEFNPNKPQARVRFSIAHELAHTLFPDCRDSIRYRLSPSERKDDDWQLEMLCNLAAAELLMPIGCFPELKSTELSIERILDLRKQFQVSVEALLLRVIRLTDAPCAMFTASRREYGPNSQRYLLDYTVGSRNWRMPLTSGRLLPSGTLLGECTAIGFTAKGEEQWPNSTGNLRLQCVGIPSFPGEKTPRVAGFAVPVTAVPAETPRITFLVGDATEPRGTACRIVAHVVNDKSPTWGAGFGLAVRRRWPEVQEAFRAWALNVPRALSLGSFFHTNTSDPKTTFFEMVCQSGYGPSAKPRIRYAALKECLDQLSDFARERGATVHMPRIGVGEGGGSWGLIQQLIDELVCARGIHVTVYDLPDQASFPQRAQIGLFDTNAR